MIRPMGISPQQFKQLQDRLRAVPGVVSVSGGLTLPLDGQVVNVPYGNEDALSDPTAFRQANTAEPQDYAGLIEAVGKGWALAWWCESAECEAKVKEDSRATTRCIPLDQSDGEGKCIICGAPARRKVIFGRAY